MCGSVDWLFAARAAVACPCTLAAIESDAFINTRDGWPRCVAIGQICATLRLFACGGCRKCERERLRRRRRQIKALNINWAYPRADKASLALRRAKCALSRSHHARVRSGPFGGSIQRETECWATLARAWHGQNETTSERPNEPSQAAPQPLAFSLEAAAGRVFSAGY